LSVFGHLPLLLSLGSSSFLHVATIGNWPLFDFITFIFAVLYVPQNPERLVTMFGQIKKVYDAHAYGSAILVVVVVAFGFA
jgi:hypothetical protein